MIVCVFPGTQENGPQLDVPARAGDARRPLLQIPTRIFLFVSDNQLCILVALGGLWGG